MFTAFTDIKEAVNFTFNFILVISVLLLALITVMMIVFVVRYHRKRHPVPQKVAESHTALEIIWTVVPTLLALGMFYYGWLGYKLMRTVPPDAMEVMATARMWSWEFEYDNGKNSPELYVPLGSPIKVNLQSSDVIHSFYLPAQMVKQDVVPGLDDFVWFQADEAGEFDIFCAEYCGQLHSYMLSKLHVIPEREFTEWVETDLGMVEDVPESETDEERLQRLRRIGEQLSQTKGCNVCHSVDGSKIVGPSYKGLFGRKETVVTNGQKRDIVVDEEYVRRSILEPNHDIVDGFQPLMPPQAGLISDEELDALVEYLKTIK